MKQRPINVLIVEDQLLLLHVSLEYFTERGFAVSMASNAR